MLKYSCKVAILVIIFLTSACASNFRQGLQHLEANNYPAALSFFEQDANAGQRVPAIITSQIYIFDYQVPRDLELSRKYLRLALDADYSRYDQVWDYYLPLIKAYQILADTEIEDKQLAFDILNYEKYEDYPWALNALAQNYLVGYGVAKDSQLAKNYFERAVENTIFDGSNLLYAFWLSVHPDESFRDPIKAMSLASDLEEDEDYSDKPLYLDTLAAAHAANAQFDKAVAVQQTAIDRLQEDITQYPYMSQYKDSFASRLQAYRNKQYWRFTTEAIDSCGFDPKRCMNDFTGQSLSLTNGLRDNVERRFPGLHSLMSDAITRHHFFALTTAH